VRLSPSRSAVRIAAAVGALTLTAVGVATPAGAAPSGQQATAVIVQLRPGSDAAAAAHSAEAQGGRTTHVYRTVFRGFAGEFTDRAIAALQRNPNVALVEADGVATTTSTQSPATWGLDRIDQRGRTLNNTYTTPSDGGGVTAYIVDTGIDPTSGRFENRVGGGTTSITDGGGTKDCNGHGTHVAGTVGSTTYGVAEDVTLVPVRVLNCSGSGSWSGVIAGLDWVAANHQAGQPAVANMSLGGPRNSSVDAAVDRVVSDGVTVAVAAGNDNRDACSFSPARVAGAITAGATDKADARASFSNYGTCVDLFAPGVSITSEWLSGGTNTISGTSMATPHVAGAAAVLLAQNPGLSPSAVAAALVQTSTTNVVTRAGKGSPNRLLFVG
jgi:aqualysin 1